MKFTDIMTLKNISILLSLSFILACGHPNSQENSKVKPEFKKQVLMPNAGVSDDSLSVLRIRHDDYTGSLDFVADSGTVYMTNKTYSALVKALQTDSLLSTPVNTVDMHFSDHNDLEKLWPGEGRYMTGTKYDGGWKEFIITGKVSGFISTKGSFRNSIEIIFDMQDFREIPGTGDYTDREKKPGH